MAKNYTKILEDKMDGPLKLYCDNKYTINQCCQDHELTRRSSEFAIFPSKIVSDRRWDRTISGSERSNDPRVGSDDSWAPMIHDTAQIEKPKSIKP